MDWRHLSHPSPLPKLRKAMVGSASPSIRFFGVLMFNFVDSIPQIFGDRKPIEHRHIRRELRDNSASSIFESAMQKTTAQFNQACELVVVYDQTDLVSKS
jgi:hypothetical protein